MSMVPVEASWFYPCLCGYWRSAAFFADTFNTQLMNELVTFSNHKIIDCIFYGNNGSLTFCGYSEFSLCYSSHHGD